VFEVGPYIAQASTVLDQPGPQHAALDFLCRLTAEHATRELGEKIVARFLAPHDAEERRLALMAIYPFAEFASAAYAEVAKIVEQLPEHEVDARVARAVLDKIRVHALERIALLVAGRCFDQALAELERTDRAFALDVGHRLTDSDPEGAAWLADVAHTFR
jgi:hypothetical protein